MYNRYIPQSDGTYQRSRIPEKQPQHRPPVPQPQAVPYPEQPPTEQDSSPVFHGCPYHPRPASKPVSAPVSSFLRQLLPGNFDTVDLLVVLLLLLMSGDHAEDQNTALLTLALYLFL